jgi:hypothetical protein
MCLHKSPTWQAALTHGADRNETRWDGLWGQCRYVGGSDRVSGGWTLGTVQVRGWMDSGNNAGTWAVQVRGRIG